MSTMNDATVVVARCELTTALRQRLSFDPAVLVFSALEATHALSTVLHRGLPSVALDRRFVTSPRGAEFIFELRTARPESEIRILNDEGGEIPLLLRRPLLATGRATIAAASQPMSGDLRRAPRYPLLSGCAALVNGEPTSLVNLSVSGAQLLSPSVLRPSEHVRLAFADESHAVKVQAAVAWSAFERSRKTGETCYRAGLQFMDAESSLLEAYCSKYGIRE